MLLFPDHIKMDKKKKKKVRQDVKVKLSRCLTKYPAMKHISYLIRHHAMKTY